MAKTKKENEEVKINSSSALGDILEATKGEHFNDIIPENIPISTGSLILDSLVTIRSGSIIRLCGSGAELGKTSEALVLAQNFMDKVDKSKTIYFKAESRLSPEIQARSGLKFVTQKEDWTYGTVFVFSINIFESVADGMEKILKASFEAGEKICFIIDSLDGLMLRNDSTKDLWGNDSPKVAGVPLMLKLLFRRMGLPIAHYDALLIITTQYSAAIKLDPYSKDVPRQVEGSGGSAIGHQNDYTFYYTPRYQGDFLLEDQNAKPDLHKNKIVGVMSTIEIRKSATDVSGTRVKIPIKKGRIGCAIWSEREVVDMLLAFSLLIKKGGWFALSEIMQTELTKQGFENVPVQLQGINAWYAFLEENKLITKYLFDKFTKINSGQ